MKIFPYTDWIGVVIATTALAIAGCGGGSGGSSAEGTNPLAVTFPTDLAITSPMAAGDASANLAKAMAKEDGQDPEGDDNTDFVKPADEYREEVHDIIFATDRNSCTFAINLFMRPPEARCYGPQLTYQNHPDGADDCNGVQPGCLPGGDTGIWAEYNYLPDPAGQLASTGEACAAAKVNELVGNVSFKVETAVKMFAGMLCLANVEGQAALPAIGEVRDFTSLLAGSAIPGVTVTAATVAREADAADGTPVYLSHIAATLTSPDGTKSATIDINLKHNPKDADNTQYLGKLWFTMASETGQLPVGGPANCNGVTDPEGAKMIASSVSYEKNAAGDIGYHARGAAYCDITADPSISATNHTIDPAKIATDQYQPPPPPAPSVGKGDPLGQKGWNGNFTMLTYAKAADGSEKLSSAWQAGGGDHWTRTLIAEVSGQEGSKTGCGYFGYGPAVDQPGVGEITNFFCRWTGPGNKMNEGASRDDGHPWAQKQCFAQRGGPVFASVSDSLHIRYAPCEACSVTDVADQDFVFSAVGDKWMMPAGITSNDKTTAGEWTSDLILIAGNVPAAPAPPPDIEQ